MGLRVIIADDHPIVLAGVAQVVRQMPSCELVAQVADGTELVRVLADEPCDVLIADYAMPRGDFTDGLALIEFIRRRHDATRIIVFTMLDNPLLVHRLREIGVSGLLSKMDSFEHITMAINAMQANARYSSPTMRHLLDEFDQNKSKDQPMARLSPRELEVVRLFGAGLSVSEIAEKFNRSIKTVSSQRSSAMKKLGVRNDAEFFSAIHEHKLL